MANSDMRQEVQALQGRVQSFLLLNLLAALILPLFVTVFGGLPDYLIAFVVGGLVLTIADRRYGHAMLWSIIFILYLLWEILVSNVALAWLILNPKPRLDPGIVAVPLTITTELSITTLATAITLTPGTMSVDLRYDEREETYILYVHSLTVAEPDHVRAKIHNGFERMIRRITEGAIHLRSTQT